MILLSDFHIPLSLSIHFTMFVTTERLIHMRYLDMYPHYITRSKTAISMLVTSVAGILGGLAFAANTTHNMFATLTNVGVVVATVLLISLTALFLTTYCNLQGKIRNISLAQNDTQADANSQLFLTKCVLFIMLILWIGWGSGCVIYVVRLLTAYRGLKNWDGVFL